MARQGSVSFGASRRPLYDAAVGALFVLICAASVYLPILLLPGAIVLCALLRGGRTTYPALLFALGFAAIVLVCGSFLFAILALVFLLFAVLPIALFQKKLAGRAHFDGGLVQCAGVALGIAAVEAARNTHRCSESVPNAAPRFSTYVKCRTPRHSG